MVRVKQRKTRKTKSKEQAKVFVEAVKLSARPIYAERYVVTTEVRVSVLANYEQQVPYKEANQVIRLFSSVDLTHNNYLSSQLTNWH